MTEFQKIADRFEIDALRAEFTDARMMRDYDRLAALFTDDGRWCIPSAPTSTSVAARHPGGHRAAAATLGVLRAEPARGRGLVDGDIATGRGYVTEFGRLRDGSSHANHAVYHDRYTRTADGWRFTERVYEIRYVDDSPLPGAPATVR